VPKVNYSNFHAVEATRWTNAYMTEKVTGLQELGFGDNLKIADARSGIILEGLTIGNGRGSAHINLTLSDGIEYLHLAIFDQLKTKVAKGAIYYKINQWTASITLTEVTKTMIENKLKPCINITHPNGGQIKTDLERIVSVLFQGCKDA
jgi:hypothetical protein